MFWRRRLYQFFTKNDVYLKDVYVRRSLSLIKDFVLDSSHTPYGL